MAFRIARICFGTSRPLNYALHFVVVVVALSRMPFTVWTEWRQVHTLQHLCAYDKYVICVSRLINALIKIICIYINLQFHIMWNSLPTSQSAYNQVRKEIQIKCIALQRQYTCELIATWALSASNYERSTCFRFFIFNSNSQHETALLIISCAILFVFIASSLARSFAFWLVCVCVGDQNKYSRH